MSVSYTHLDVYKRQPVAHQVVSLYAAKNKFLQNVEPKSVGTYEKEMLKFMEREHADIFAEIDEKQKLDEALENKIKTALETFTKQYEAMLEG